MWLTNQNELEEIQEVKINRPHCDYTDDYSHTFIEYQSSNEKVCHDCGYTEKLIIKE
jgi:hypothetical protein